MIDESLVDDVEPRVVVGEFPAEGMAPPVNRIDPPAVARAQ
jgi:hypothetical protein